jgi:basic membrane protein A
MRLLALIITVIIGTLVVAACQTTAPPPILQASVDSTAKPYTHRIGIIFESNDGEGNPLHQLAWQGAENAAQAFPVEITPLEIHQQADLATDSQRFSSGNYDLLIGIGTPVQQAIATAARSNPEQLFVLVDDQPGHEPNIHNIRFDMIQPSFLAGYLAAGISANGVVCTYGNLDVPGVIDYLQGFANGVGYYNMQRSADVTILGWDQDTQTGAVSDSFQSSGGERQLVSDYFNAGCDVLFPVTHTINLGLASLAQEHDLAVIGVDIDWFMAAPEFSKIWLTSVQKNLDQAMFDTIEALAHDTLDSEGDYTGTLDNGGVELASFHLWDDKIPDDLKAELVAITQALIDQRLDPGDENAFH